MKSVKTLVFLVLWAVCAKSQITIPSPSPFASVSSRVGLTNVSIEYYRPKLRGRQIFGSDDDVLVSYGKLWRTGAADGTVISLSTAVKIGGKVVPPGKYLILTIPEKEHWKFILYSDLLIDGANLSGTYKKENVALETTVPAIKTCNTV